MVVSRALVKKYGNTFKNAWGYFNKEPFFLKSQLHLMICPSRLNPAIAAVRDTRRAATGIAVTVYEGMFGANGPLLPPGQT